MRKIIWGTAALLVVAVVAILYFVFDPSSNPMFPKCGFLMMTGYKCPGCGMQRMLHALLHGDVIGAFRYNAYVMIVFPFIGGLFLLEFYRERFPRLYLRLSSVSVGFGILGATLLWWVLRNVFSI